MMNKHMSFWFNKVKQANSYSLMRRMNTEIESDGKRHGCTV